MPIPVDIIVQISGYQEDNTKKYCDRDRKGSFEICVSKYFSIFQGYIQNNRRTHTNTHIYRYVYYVIHVRYKFLCKVLCGDITRCTL